MNYNIEKHDHSHEIVLPFADSSIFKGTDTIRYRYIVSRYDDEKIKLQTGQICNYCGSADKLALDHIFPQRLGGKDDAENLIFACRTCNSSKGKKDLMEWMAFRGQFLPIMIIRRYLKLTFNYCNDNGLLDQQIDDLKGMELPFRIDLLPTSFPKPNELTLNVDEKQHAL